MIYGYIISETSTEIRDRIGSANKKIHRKVREKSIFCGDAMLEKESKYVGDANTKIPKTKAPASRKHLAQRVFQKTSKERIPADKNQNHFQNYRTRSEKLTQRKIKLVFN